MPGMLGRLLAAALLLLATGCSSGRPPAAANPDGLLGLPPEALAALPVGGTPAPGR